MNYRSTLKRITRNHHGIRDITQIFAQNNIIGRWPILTEPGGRGYFVSEGGTPAPWRERDDRDKMSIRYIVGNRNK